MHEVAREVSETEVKLWEDDVRRNKKKTHLVSKNSYKILRATINLINTEQYL